MTPNSKQQSPENRASLVIGVGLIGTKICESLISAGHKVYAMDRNPQALENLKSNIEDNNQLELVEGDALDQEFLSSLLRKALNGGLPITSAVNLSYPRNSQYGRAFFDVELEDFQENVASHTTVYFSVMQTCAAFSIQNDVEFSLVNFSSIYGVIAPKFEVYGDTTMTMPVEYAAVKAAIIHLTRYLTNYAKGSKFRVNCVSPGGILDNQPPSFLAAYAKESRSKGMLDATDIIGATLFLMSDQSKYVCGQNIVVDDGFST